MHSSSDQEIKVELPFVQIAVLACSIASFATAVERDEENVAEQSAGSVPRNHHFSSVPTTFCDIRQRMDKERSAEKRKRESTGNSILWTWIRVTYLCWLPFTESLAPLSWRRQGKKNQHRVRTRNIVLRYQTLPSRHALPGGQCLGARLPNGCPPASKSVDDIQASVCVLGRWISCPAKWYKSSQTIRISACQVWEEIIQIAGTKENPPMLTVRLCTTQQAQDAMDLDLEPLFFYFQIKWTYSM